MRPKCARFRAAIDLTPWSRGDPPCCAEPVSAEDSPIASIDTTCWPRRSRGGAGPPRLGAGGGAMMTCLGAYAGVGGVPGLRGSWRRGAESTSPAGELARLERSMGGRSIDHVLMSHGAAGCPQAPPVNAAATRVAGLRLNPKRRPACAVTVANLTDVARKGTNDLLFGAGLSTGRQDLIPSARRCRRSVSARIASALTAADLHEIGFPSGRPHPDHRASRAGNLQRRAQNYPIAGGRSPPASPERDKMDHDRDHRAGARRV
jgi:hypothetical protein